MKKTPAALLCAALALGLLAACGNNNGTEWEPIPDANEALMPGTGEEDVAIGEGAVPEEERDFLDDGTGAAVVGEQNVVSEYGFTMDYPEGWSYMSLAEADLDEVYIFAAVNRATSSTLMVSQALDAAEYDLDAFAAVAYERFGEVVELYEVLGLSPTLGALGQTTLSGRDAWHIQLTAFSEEVDIDNQVFIVETPAGEIVNFMVTTYDEADSQLAMAALGSITWE